MKITIKAKFSDRTIIEGEYKSLKHAVTENKADLREAGLREANLWETNLQGADLREADLWGADLRGANLRGAALWGADLREADLREADLWGADLREADLWGAALWEANLRGAALWGADLRGAALWGADLWGEKIKQNPMQILGYAWPIMIAGTKMKIGCEVHTIENWKEFKDSRVKLMSKDALEWWKEHKPLIMPMAVNHLEKERGKE